MFPGAQSHSLESAGYPVVAVKYFGAEDLFEPGSGPGMDPAKSLTAKKNTRKNAHFLILSVVENMS